MLPAVRVFSGINGPFIRFCHAPSRLVQADGDRLMKAHLFGAHPSGWIALASLACVIVPLSIVSPPSVMPRADAVARLNADAVTLDTVRFDFDRAWRTSENTTGPAGAAEFDDAIARIQRSVERLGRSGDIEGQLAVPLGRAIAAYRDAVVATPPVARPRDSGLDAAAIASTIGQLATADEAALREPLLGMLDAQREFEATGEPRFTVHFNLWSDAFLTRLDALAIPDGTRSALAMKLAAYQHAALTRTDGRGAGPEAPRAAAMAVAAAVDNFDEAMADQRKAMIDAMNHRLGWLTGGAFALITAAAVVLGRDIRRDLGFAAGRTPVRATNQFAFPTIASGPSSIARHG
jgi:hypothetical protein